MPKRRWTFPIRSREYTDEFHVLAFQCDAGERGGHAHKKMHQLIIAMSGSFDVILDDGSERKRFHLNRSYYGLHLSPMTWRELDNFSSGSICLALASEIYDETLILAGGVSGMTQDRHTCQ
jgi:hypothetical protein